MQTGSIQASSPLSAKSALSKRYPPFNQTSGEDSQAGSLHPGFPVALATEPEKAGVTPFLPPAVEYGRKMPVGRAAGFLPVSGYERDPQPPQQPHRRPRQPKRSHPSHPSNPTGRCLAFSPPPMPFPQCPAPGPAPPRRLDGSDRIAAARVRRRRPVLPGPELGGLRMGQ